MEEGKEKTGFFTLQIFTVQGKKNRINFKLFFPDFNVNLNNEIKPRHCFHFPSYGFSALLPIYP